MTQAIDRLIIFIMLNFIFLCYDVRAAVLSCQCVNDGATLHDIVHTKFKDIRY